MPYKDPNKRKEYMRGYYRDNKDKWDGLKDYYKEYRRQLRAEIIDYYGGKCACCGEYRIEFLCIDHINGGGNAHRRSLFSTSKGGHQFYLWLKKNDFPEGFQVLCHNCNHAYGHYGYCPHAEGDRNG